AHSQASGADGVQIGHNQSFAQSFGLRHVLALLSLCPGVTKLVGWLLVGCARRTPPTMPARTSTASAKKRVGSMGQASSVRPSYPVLGDTAAGERLLAVIPTRRHKFRLPFKNPIPPQDGQNQYFLQTLMRSFKERGASHEDPRTFRPSSPHRVSRWVAY